MVSIEKCKAELKNCNRKYSDEEIRQIRDLLYKIATIEYERFKTEPQEKGCGLQESINGGAERERI